MASFALGGSGKHVPLKLTRQCRGPGIGRQLHIVLRSIAVIGIRQNAQPCDKQEELLGPA